ncbi:MAG TPA: hypothetical protein VI564_02990 [Candidatus Nanoarchaeia archaeon]|nr:hypothetical protein [Candidatus Nanoarchaeia archaeon]
MKSSKKLLFITLILLSLSLYGCSSSISGSIDVTNSRPLESGEALNMYLNLEYKPPALFGGPAQKVTLDFSTGEGLEILKDGKVIQSDVVDSLTGATKLDYQVRAKVIKSQQVIDNVKVSVRADDGASSTVQGPSMTIVPKR